MPKKTEIKIENIVGKTRLGVKINLREIVKKIPQIEYNPESFPAATLKFENPKASILIFSTGSMVCAGAKSFEEVKHAFHRIKQKLRENGYKDIFDGETEISNMVASASIGEKINLDKIALTAVNCEYAPEQFPALVYRPDKMNTVILIFNSGKMVVTGAKTMKQLRMSVETAKEMVLQNIHSVIKG